MESFIFDGEKLLRTGVIRQDIAMEEDRPIPLASSGTPVNYQIEVRIIIDCMLRNKVIETSRYPWATPVVLVRKKSDKLRMCVGH